MPLVVSIDVGTKNLAYCILDHDSRKIHEWVVCTIPAPSTHIPNVVTFLRSIMPPPEEISHVVIEKQPARNVKMRIMENVLSTFFTTVGVPHVTSYSAKLKLGAIGKTAKGKTNYTLRKKMSVAMAGVYLSELGDEHAQLLFTRSTKKDDLADCLLQALSFLEYDVNALSAKGIVTV